MNKPGRDNYIYFSLLWPIYINHHSIIFPLFGDYMTGFDTVKHSHEWLFWYSYSEPSHHLWGKGDEGEERNSLHVDTSRGADSTEAIQRKEFGEATMSSNLSISFKS